VGEAAESEVARFGCAGGCVEVIVIGVVFGSELGGDCGALGDFDLDRERGWTMESCVVDRERDGP
jgi:hypothetical protein